MLFCQIEANIFVWLCQIRVQYIFPICFNSGIVSSSVVDPNTLNLDPDPECWPNLDPDPRFWPNLDPDQDPG